MLNSTWFKRIYFAVPLILMGVGLYIVISPEPFLKLGYIGVFFLNALGGLGTYLIPPLSLKMNIWLLALYSPLALQRDRISPGVLRAGLSKVFYPDGIWKIY